MIKKNRIPLKNIYIVIIITAIVTSLTTGIIIYNNYKIENGAVDISKDEALKEFLRVYSSLDDGYYENFDKTKMIESAIAGMLDYLGEDYSTYLNKQQTDELTSQLSGTYYGIGVSIIDKNVIYKVYPNTPAEEVGLLTNDIILSVNGTDTTASDTVNISSLLNKQGENTLLIQRGEEKFEIKVTAKEINDPLTREVKEQNGKRIGYIYIPAFSNTVAEEFTKALNELEGSTIDSLVIDMRSNSGGYLAAATKIASMFLEKGKIIYTLESKEKTESYQDDSEEHRSYPIAILTNEGTASASEILAAALKDSYNAILIGEATYGKGKVQQTKTLEDGSMVKYTTARWFTPSGECIDGYGLFPDYSVKIEKDENNQYIDTQLNKALEILSTK